MNRFYERFFKRIFDFCGSLILIVLFLPILFVLVVLVVLTMGRPVFFIQKRPGRNEKVFKIYKLRTMNDRKNEDGSLQADNYRLTPIGKFLRKYSLDELPQLFNVLKGDLSFIGPRPLLTQYLPLYSKDQKRRHNVRPGITGWAQVNGRNAISWEEKFKFDVWYVDNVSLFLDLKILILTVIKVFGSDGINSSETATMETFKGTKL